MGFLQICQQPMFVSLLLPCTRHHPPTCTPCLRNCKTEEIINLQSFPIKISPVQEPSLFCFLHSCCIYVPYQNLEADARDITKTVCFCSSWVQASFNSKDAGSASNQRLTHWGPQTFALQRLPTFQMPVFLCSLTIQKPHFKNLHSVYIFKYRKGNTSVSLRTRGLMRFQKVSMIMGPRN